MARLAGRASTRFLTPGLRSVHDLDELRKAQMT